MEPSQLVAEAALYCLVDTCVYLRSPVFLHRGIKDRLVEMRSTLTSLPKGGDRLTEDCRNRSSILYSYLFDPFVVMNKGSNYGSLKQSSRSSALVFGLSHVFLLVLFSLR